MGKIKQNYQMRGFKRNRFEEYFKSIGGIETSRGVFESSDWKVVLSDEESVSIGSIKFPEVDVEIICDESIFDEFIESYKIKFLTAGG